MGGVAALSDRLDFTLAGAGGVDLCCYEWPCEQARAAVVVMHGMAEHAARYGRFAAAVNGAGYAVLSMDLRGHGAAAARGKKGWFAEKDGWRAVLEDIRLLTEEARRRYASIPLVLFGHSMGSIFARAALSRFGMLYRAAVLTGVTVDVPFRRNVAPAIAAAVSALQGKDRPSPLLDSLTFGAYNKPFAPARTRFDWLSRDPDEVDKYVGDDNCGFVCTGSMFVDVARVLLDTLRAKSIAGIPKALPILILSGAEDPAGMCGHAAAYLRGRYGTAGLAVETKVYEGARHELLNEVNRDEVTADILAFMQKAVG